jgi:hypothetical protein
MRSVRLVRRPWQKLTKFNKIGLDEALSTWYYPLMNKETTMTIGDLIGGILFTAIMFGFAFLIGMAG